MRIAVLGANGFIGSRLVELLHLSGAAEPRPIVRTAARLAGAARFALDGRVADGFDEPALAEAMAGCEAVVHAISGDRRTIVETAANAYRAAQAAGLRRMIYLSSAAVHGQAPAPGTDETSPLNRRQPIAYNRSKIEAETALRRLRKAGKVELVILRPGIVFGPRSCWTGGLADETLTGTACLVDGGAGICNALYVDNLVHAIKLAASRSSIDGEAFLLGQEETVTWRDLYRPVVEALGRPIEEIPSVGYRPEPPWRRAARNAAARLPYPARAGLHAARHALAPPPAATARWRQSRPAPVATLEKALLHRCRVKLPWTKARAKLGYEPVVGYDEGCRRAIAWLDFAGYPVVGGR